MKQKRKAEKVSLTNYSYIGYEIGTSHYPLNEIRAWCRDQVEIELTDLYSSNHELVKPIPLIMRYEDKIYYAIQKDLDIWSEDMTYEGSLRLIAHKITALFDRLTILSPQNKLGPYPRELFTYLKNYVKSA